MMSNIRAIIVITIVIVIVGDGGVCAQRNDHGNGNNGGRKISCDQLCKRFGKNVGGCKCEYNIFNFRHQDRDYGRSHDTSYDRNEDRIEDRSHDREYDRDYDRNDY
jgi:hypothetical protein